MFLNEGMMTGQIKDMKLIHDRRWFVKVFNYNKKEVFMWISSDDIRFEAFLKEIDVCYEDGCE